MALDATKPNKKRVLSGMRSTGKLHLGNYVGALANWVKLQETHDCFFFVADWHALTTDYADTSGIKESCLEVVLDWLAAGLDPEKCTMFIQSHVPAHAELHLLFSMITPLGWLERVPTYKEQQQNIKDKDLNTYGFLGYPVLQSADILVYKADLVPVGEDQVAHIELTREIARRFNGFYKKTRKRVLPPPGPPGVMQGYPTLITEETAILVEPQPLLTPAARLRGSDGRKMSKSYGNSILLTDSSDRVAKVIASYVTDRSERQEPGDPDACPVGDLYSAFGDTGRREWAFNGCRTASISCHECKQSITEGLNTFLDPIRERRVEFQSDPAATWAIIERGSERASSIARETLLDVREGMNMSHGFDSLAESFPGSLGKRSTYLFLPFEETEALGDRTKQGDARRQGWLRYATREVPLAKTDVHRVYTTPARKRVCIVTSGEHDGFVFKPRDRTYEVLVLLFHMRSGEIIDFVLPTKHFRAFWKSLPREDKSVRIDARHENGHFFLVLPHDESFALDEFKSRYDLLR